SRVYCDGVVDLSDAETWTNLKTTNYRLTVGTCDNFATEYFDGLISELRISNVARNTGWIKTVYSGMKNLNNFYSLGSEESIPP
ncbi:unnamed protein product, partial [marine sediment metagenome]